MVDYKNKDGSVLKFRDTDMDFLLKQKIVDLFDVGVSHLINGSLKKAFEAFKMLFYFISSYEFSLKNDLTELVSIMTNYFDELSDNQKPSRSDQLVLKSQKKVELRELLDLFMSMVPASYAELGLWFTTRATFDDFDLQMSDENFNDDLSNIEAKKRFLLSKTVKTLIDNLSANSINDVFARLRIAEVLRE